MPIGRNIKGAYTIWYRDVIRFSRDRPRIIAALAQPMLYLFVFGTGLGAAMSGSPAGAVDFRQFMFPGTLAMTVLFTAIFSAISIVWDREFGFLKEVMVAPVSRTAVALGKVAGGATVAMFQGVVALLLAPIVGVKLSIDQIASIVGLMLLLATVMTSFGILIAARQKSMEGFQMMINFLLMPMFFLSGAFFPLEFAPTWLKTISQALPMRHLVDGMLAVMVRGQPPSSVVPQLGILLAFAVVVTVIARLMFRWDDD